MAHHLDFKPEELVATLKHSDDTFLLVEGTDDVMIYRWLIEQIGIEKISFQPCNGRENLLNLFERRAEIKSCKTVFVADKDTFVYSKVPMKYILVGAEVEQFQCSPARKHSAVDIFDRQAKGFVEHLDRVTNERFRSPLTWLPNTVDQNQTD